MTNHIDPKRLGEDARAEERASAERATDLRGGRVGQGDLTPAFGGKFVTRLLDPVDRPAALADDLATWRSDRGPNATAQLEQVLDDVCGQISRLFREKRRSNRNYGAILGVIAWHLDDFEQTCSDPRRYRDLVLTSLTAQQFVSQLQDRRIPYREITPCPDSS
jgi:hypothetical protein